MSSGEAENQKIRIPLLDRLIDEEPQDEQEIPADNAERRSMLQRGVRRDLEDLLNTRYRCTVWPPDQKELQNSLINYGIPDFTAAGLNAAEDGGILLQAIENAIGAFEPRLTDVKVFRVPNDEKRDRTFRFRIEAVLMVEGGRLAVQFESSMQTATGQFDISSPGGEQ